MVINAVAFWLAGAISHDLFHAGFYVDGFWAAFWGSIVISVATFLLSLFVLDPDESLFSRPAR